MKQILKALACTMACATLLTSCELFNKSMSVTIAGVDKINIEGAKALASLRDVSGTRAGGDMTRAGGGETLLYAIDEENNIKLPEISCNFVFDEEMTEEERQEVIKNMNATIQTQGIYDFGPYILVRYTLSYTSSYEVINGLGHLEVSVGFLHSAIRKSDGKNFMVYDANNGGVLHDIIERLNYWVLRKSVAVSESEACLLYSEGMWSCNLIKVLEQEDKVYISTESDNVPDWDVLKDQHGNVYVFKYNQILTYKGETPLEGTYNSVAQLGGQVYAFAIEDGRVKVYKILDGERQLDADIEGEYILGEHIGTANGEILWRDGLTVTSYNPATKTLKSKGLAIELLEIMCQNPSLFLNEHMFYARSNGNGVEVVKINLFDDSQEIIPVEIPSDRVVEAYRFIGSAASNYVQLYLTCQAGKDFVYDVYGNSSLPDFAGYEVNKVIPLK